MINARRLPIVPGAIGDNPEPNPRDNHDRGFLRFILKVFITGFKFYSCLVIVV